MRFRYWGQGTLIGSYTFQVVPIVSSSREHANACQHTPEVPRAPEHVNKLYEKGGLCISGTGGRAHPDHPGESRTCMKGGVDTYGRQGSYICLESQLTLMV